MSDDDEPPRLVFYKEDIEAISKTLLTFLQNTQARCVLLADKDGHLLTREGDASAHEMDALSALVVDSFVSTRQLTKLLGEQKYSFLVFERDSIQLSRVGQRTILAVVFGERGNLGMTQLYAQQVSSKLSELFSEIEKRGRQGPGDVSGAPVRA